MKIEIKLWLSYHQKADDVERQMRKRKKECWIIFVCICNEFIECVYIRWQKWTILSLCLSSSYVWEREREKCVSFSLLQTKTKMIGFEIFPTSGQWSFEVRKNLEGKNQTKGYIE